MVGPGSATVFDVITHARGIARPVFIFDAADTHFVDLHEHLSGMATCLTARSGRMSPPATLAGITTFAEEKAADLAHHHGLPYHTPDTARGVRDKAVQRAALGAAGLVARNAVAYNFEQIAEIVKDLGVDCIVKPLAGAGSRMTFRDLLGAVRDAVARRTPISSVPDWLLTTGARLLVLILRDQLLTRDEYRAMATGLADTQAPATGATRFHTWLEQEGPQLGRRHLNDTRGRAVPSPTLTESVTRR